MHRTVRRSSPRRRRWSGPDDAAAPDDPELSAKAEVVRRATARPEIHPRALREGGGGPCSGGVPRRSPKSSPRRRRWSVGAVSTSGYDPELSAKAEVVRRSRPCFASRRRALREG